MFFLLGALSAVSVGGGESEGDTVGVHVGCFGCSICHWESIGTGNGKEKNKVWNEEIVAMFMELSSRGTAGRQRLGRRFEGGEGGRNRGDWKKEILLVCPRMTQAGGMG